MSLPEKRWKLLAGPVFPVLVVKKDDAFFSFPHLAPTPDLKP